MTRTVCTSKPVSEMDLIAEFRSAAAESTMLDQLSFAGGNEMPTVIVRTFILLCAGCQTTYTGFHALAVRVAARGLPPSGQGPRRGLRRMRRSDEVAMVH